MKILLLLICIVLCLPLCFSQPSMTLWITPDGYHADHNHSASQQYFCDSSYYIFYHTNPDSLFITVKNDGNENLELNSLSTQAFNGSNFEVSGFNSQILAPGEMYTIKLLYQLPPEYFNGINGAISFESNDPAKSSCTLSFDIGCFIEWNFRANPFAGVDGTCEAPIVWVKESNSIRNAQMFFDDSMTFYAFNTNPDTALRVIKMTENEIRMHGDVVAVDRLFAGLTKDGTNAFNVDSFSVNVNQDMTVKGKLRTLNIIDADGGITCSPALTVTGNTNLDGPLDVTGNAVVHGTLEVDVMTSPSDSRLKKDIYPLEESISKVMCLSPKKYFLKTDEDSSDQQFGFLAQELENVIPQIVHTDADGMKSVNYLQIIPWLTAAVQEQQNEIVKLKNEIVRLKGN